MPIRPTPLTSALLLALLCGCGPSDKPGASADTAAPEAPEQGLLIAELYYAGAEPVGGADHYFSDQFVELVNASSEVMDLSGVMLGEVYGSAGEINPGMEPDSFRRSHPDHVVLSTVWQIPGGVQLAPGDTLIVAHDGSNHRPFSTVDLSGAGLEAYVASSGADQDSPTVANLNPVFFTGGNDWLLTVFGPSLVVLEAGTQLESEDGPFGELRSAPVSAVLDAVETLMDGKSARFRRLPDSLSAGYAHVSGTYTGESLHRVRDGDRWQDTDDSGADFVVGAPDPTLKLVTGEVTGDPWIELGAGLAAFEPLADGDTVELIAGHQGGWHVDVSVRGGDFGPDGVVLAYDALDATSAESVSFDTRALLSAASVLPLDDGWERVDDRIVFDIASAEEVVDRAVVLRVTASLGGLTWSDERSVTVVDLEP
ncbi:MAG: hypothetical protein ACI9K2_003770 [Myxococcota bacterium]|jgi:hypothetical protein